MFDFKKAIGASLETHPQDKVRPMLTSWGEKIDPDAVLQEYPRPQMRRDSYLSLNGYWEYAIRDSEDAPEAFDGQILVPFSPEALLSGVGRQLLPDEVLWYRRELDVNPVAGKRMLLHFGAVDYECKCLVNGQLAGSHIGAYDPFCFDITDCLLREGPSVLEVSVKDPSEYGHQPRGKQRIDRGSIWYTAQSGIWQTVWIEEVPDVHIMHVCADANPDLCTVTVTVDVAGVCAKQAPYVNVGVMDDGATVASGSAAVGSDGHATIGIDIEAPHLWSPDDPHLYDLVITCEKDKVESYCAFRTFTVEFAPESHSDRRTFCLNHKPFFLKGLLDQGYWPDGLMTAPSDEAFVFDIQLAKRLGFNMLRMHIKVESSRWYYHCDRLGMIVWQDAVNGGSDYPIFWTSQFPTLFPCLAERIDDREGYERFGSEDSRAREAWERDAGAMVRHLRGFPCIATWTVFNEGWGQFDSMRMTRMVRHEDPTRPIDQTSGWFDQGGADYMSIHNYFRPLTVPTPRTKGDRRAPVISEFGGVAYHVRGHSSLARAYGYSLMDSMESFEDAVNETLGEADALAKEGLAGYVYTQLSDVEEEVNGLVTYDRRVVKVEHDRQSNACFKTPIIPASGTLLR